ncbi:AI-2E family transporter [Lederbergia citrea]|uniref:AI-2E family transporter n=1 Tax=Lederbergia citrea TaxID=2833581 RepID=A0A942UPH4_9BACI|nr:AI-2E family transporter [Lederbergia citrea]MBS4222528.1 AI-2E family transporter [Lederbergia citrea]
MKQRRLRILYNLGIILLIFIILYCFLLIKPLWKPVFTTVCIGILPFLISGFIAFLLHPLVVKLEAVGMKRVIAIILIYFLFFGGIGYAFYLGIPMMIKQMQEFSEQLPFLSEQYKQGVDNLQASTSTWPDGLQDQLDKRINAFEKWFEQFFARSAKIFVRLIDFIFVVAVIPFISFYLLKDIQEVKKAAWYMTPQKWRHSGIEFLAAVNASLGGYIRGQLLVCAIVGSAAATAFGLIGVQYPILLGVIIATTNIIPYFGPFIGAVPVVAIALLSSVKLAIIAVIIVFVLQFIEGNILSPYIVGKSLHMHPLFIIGALIIGGEAFGIIGMIVAVPTLAILKIAIIHSRDYLIRSRRSLH